MSSNSKLVLASASPRRVELLRLFNVEFRVMPSQADELHDEALSAAELCALNAARKAEEVGRKEPGAMVLGADTLVALNNRLFGKPRDLEQAVQMLTELSGKTHQVITGVCLSHAANRIHEVFTVQTAVTFKALSSTIINEYLKAVPVLDKAGAYAIQERGDMLVKNIDGSLTNVIGLPVERLAQALCSHALISPPERDRIVAAQRSAGLQISK